MEADEIRKILEEAGNNNWMPVSIVTAVFAVVISLLLYIWKTSQAEMKSRHEKSERTIEALTESNQQISLVLSKLEVIVDFHERTINELQRSKKQTA